jgi:hypothetical protein
MPIRVPEAHDEFIRATGFFESATRVDADAINWQAIGETDPYTRLLALVLVGGAAHHLEAREVTEDEDGRTSFVDYPEDYDRLCDIGGDAPEATLTIEGRVYMLFMTPHC